MPIKRKRVLPPKEKRKPISKPGDPIQAKEVAVQLDNPLEIRPDCNRDSKEFNWNSYLSTLSLQMFPANDEFKERLALELVTWARENKNALFLDEFYDLKGIIPETVIFWSKRSEKLKEAVRTAKRIIGRRRELGAMNNELNAATVHYTMPHYSDIWREEQRIRAELKNKDIDQQRPITVVIEDFDKEPGESHTRSKPKKKDK